MSTKARTPIDIADRAGRLCAIGHGLKVGEPVNVGSYQWANIAFDLLERVAEAGVAADRVRGALTMMQVGLDARPDEMLSPDELLIRHGHRRIIELIQEALDG